MRSAVLRMASSTASRLGTVPNSEVTLIASPPASSTASARREPNSPKTGTTTLSPGRTMFQTAASTPPVPEALRMSGLSVRLEEVLRLLGDVLQESRERLAPVVDHGLDHRVHDPVGDVRGPGQHDELPLRVVHPRPPPCPSCIMLLTLPTPSSSFTIRSTAGGTRVFQSFLSRILVLTFVAEYSLLLR